MQYGIWHLELKEWVCDNDGKILVFDTYRKANKFRKGIDVAPPRSPVMVVKVYETRILQMNIPPKLEPRESSGFLSDSEYEDRYRWIVQVYQDE